MKKFALLTLSILSLSALDANAQVAPNFSVPASSDTGAYIGLQGGIANSDSDTEAKDNSAVYGVTAGYKTTSNVRLEAEISQRKDKYESNLDLGTGTPFGGKGNFTNLRAMFNALYDIKNTSQFTPYVGAGAGFSKGKLKLNYTDGVNTLTADDSDTVPAWQLKGGVAYDITKNVALTTDYTYYRTINDMKMDTYANGAKIEAEESDSTHEVKAGVRYSFN